MKKKEFDFNRLPKQEYMKPEIEIVEIGIHARIMAGSVENLDTTGLDEEDELELVPSDLIPGINPWNVGM